MKITDQFWAWVYVITGCAMVLISKHAGIATDIGAGIIGAGIQAFTASAKQQNNFNSTVEKQ